MVADALVFLPEASGGVGEIGLVVCESGGNRSWDITRTKLRAHGRGAMYCARIEP